MEENAQPGDTVGTPLPASDPEGKQLTYAIVSQTTQGAFFIDASNGQIQVQTPQNHEPASKSVHSLVVKVTDPDEGKLTDTATITVSITDVAEPPVITPGQRRTVSENAAGGTSVGGIIEITDPDVPSTLITTIVGGTGAGSFQVTSEGQVQVKAGAALNYEVTPTLTLTLRATDGDGEWSEGDVVVELEDVNEAPSFTSPIFRVSVAENAAEGVKIGTAYATDPDAIDAGRLTWSLEDSAPFMIDAATGDLLVKQAGIMSFEDTPLYTLAVSVKDVSGETGNAEFEVTVVDSNEPPIIVDTSRRYVLVACQVVVVALTCTTLVCACSVQEGSAFGTMVGDPIPASDREGNAITFSIAAGNDGGGFAIDAATGQISVASPSVLDFESAPTHRLAVVATDDGPGQLAASAKVTISLTNRNEAPQVVASTFQVAENSDVGAEVGTLVASDPDADDELRFGLVSALPTAAFSVDSTTGVLTVSRSDINYEQDSKYAACCAPYCRRQ